MLRSCLVICLLLVLTTCVLGDEINGLNSRAVDISVSFSGRGQYSAAFASLDRLGRLTGITIQSRYTDDQLRGRIACTITVPLPPAARQVSHPALSTSGWLFVVANPNAYPEESDAWRLYARRHSQGRNQCEGWGNDWIDLGHFPGRPVDSAPDAVVALGDYTYVFVTDRDGYIDYRMFDNDVRRNRDQRWSDWRSLAAINQNERRQYLAASKPAVAIYNESGVRFHVFWHDSSHTRINHVAGLISIFGALVENPPDSREFRDHIGRTTARTACSAGPEITAPSRLFIVCGNNRGDSTTAYSIAHYRRPRSAWGDESPSVVWESRSAYGGFSAPSLGRTYLASSNPLMFVTFGIQFCPEPTRMPPPRPPHISPTCFEYDRWIIQNRYSTLTGWEQRINEDPIRAGRLY